MIQISWDKTIKREDVAAVLYEHQICVLEVFIYSGEIFYGIENKFLAERGFCSWGGILEYELLKEDFELDAWPGKNELQRSIDLYDADLRFWVDFIRHFVQKYRCIILRRYYDDMAIDNGSKDVLLDKLTYDDLLRIEPNQSLKIWL